MVSQNIIQASNALINDATAPRVAIFVGGTSGIGQFTVDAFVAIRDLIEKLRTVNPEAEILWVEGEVSLLAEAKRICETIKSKESRVDLLFMTPGYAPFSGRKETTEGLEVVGSLAYYSRMLFVLHLLPLLKKAEAARVIAVLGGGMERANWINLDDIGLERPGNFSFLKAQTQYTHLNTTELGKLASENPDITFIHSWPGWVNTRNVKRGLESGNTTMARFIWLFLEPLISLIACSDEDSGQRHLFQCTSATFGDHGTLWKGKQGVNSLDKETGGLFLVNYKCDCTPNVKVVRGLREKGQEKVWDYTQQVHHPYM